MGTDGPVSGTTGGFPDKAGEAFCNIPFGCAPASFPCACFPWFEMITREGW